jgi:hypothetical protein
MPAPKRDNFLADAVGAREFRVTYGDGFRFGLGVVAALLLVTLILGSLTWAVITLVPWRG